MVDCRPIGIFDSGIGGVPITRKISELLPNEHIIYVADTKHAPYGEKSDQDILQRSLCVTEFLLSRKVKTIVVACNTATVTSIKALRTRYALPFIGVEPGIKPAVLTTKSGVVGVLATSKTLVSEAFVLLAQRVAGNVRVEIQPCPELVALVEALKIDPNEAAKVVKNYVVPLLEKGADIIVLGCTHFTYLAPVIREIVGPEIVVISTETAVAKEVVRRLAIEELLAPQGQGGQYEFWSNGDFAAFQKQVHRLWGEPVEVRKF